MTTRSPAYLSCTMNRWWEWKKQDHKAFQLFWLSRLKASRWEWIPNGGGLLTVWCAVNLAVSSDHASSAVIKALLISWRLAALDYGLCLEHQSWIVDCANSRGFVQILKENFFIRHKVDQHDSFGVAFSCTSSNPRLHFNRVVIWWSEVAQVLLSKERGMLAIPSEHARTRLPGRIAACWSHTRATGKLGRDSDGV